MFAQAAKSTAQRQCLGRLRSQSRAMSDIFDGNKRALGPRRDDFVCVVFAQSLYQSHSQANSISLQRAVVVADGDIHWQDSHSLSLRLLQQLRWLVEAHRLAVDEAAD